MQFVVLNENQEPETFAVMYANPGLQGESQKMTLGSYRREQLMLKEIASMDIMPDCTCIFYEKADGTGKCASADGSVDDLARLGFVPEAFLLLPHVSCLKSGEVKQRLLFGRYPASILKEYDTIRIPKMSGISWECEPEVSLTEGEYPVSELPQTAQFFFVSVEGVIQSEAEQELSYEELLNVAAGAEEQAGGKGGRFDQCFFNSCDAQACAADLCAVQACPGNACVTNMIPVVGLI